MHVHNVTFTLYPGSLYKEDEAHATEAKLIGPQQKQLTWRISRNHQSVCKMGGNWSVLQTLKNKLYGHKEVRILMCGESLGTKIFLQCMHVLMPLSMIPPAPSLTHTQDWMQLGRLPFSTD